MTTDDPGDGAPDDPPAPPAPTLRRSAPVRAVGLVAVLAAQAAALAPGMVWYRLGEVGREGGPTTTGWDRDGFGLGREARIVGLLAPPGDRWDGWAVPGLPDGVVASLFAVVVLVVAIRIVLGGRVTRPAAGTVAGVGALGFVWVAVSWLSIRRVETWSEDEFIEDIGASESQVRQIFISSVGRGLVLTEVAFAVAAVAGLVLLRWSAPDPGEGPGPA